MTRGVKVEGLGAYAPRQVVTNGDLEGMVETSDEWITTRTGIKERRVIGEGESLSSMAEEASRKALRRANKDPEEVDMILLCTSSPDDLFGSAGELQMRLGASNAFAFDLTAACSGFVIGLVTASHYIRGGGSERCLVIGGDALSRMVDWRDRNTCVLFGDGCGAAVLSKRDDGNPCSLLASHMASDGWLGCNLTCPVHAESHPKPFSDEGTASSLLSYSNVKMSGHEVFKYAVRAVPETVETSLDRAGLSKAGIDWLVMHQANQRILDAAAERLALDNSAVVSNLASYGNTSAASIPLALDEMYLDGRLQAGHTVALAGFGAGLTTASAIFRWG